MKWFKHYSDAYSNLKHQQVIAEFGLRGYGFYWVCVEFVAQQGLNFRISSKKNWRKVLLHLTRETNRNMDRFLTYFAETGLIDKKALEMGELFIPKMRDYADEYTEKIRRKSRQGRDSVGLEEIRREEKRIEKSTPNQSISFLQTIPSSDLQELSQKYKIATRGIQSKAADLRLYCDSKGKRYKNYRAFLENALRKDAVKLRNEYPPPRVEPKIESPLTADQREKNAEKLRQIGLLARAKTV